MINADVNLSLVDYIANLQEAQNRQWVLYTNRIGMEKFNQAMKDYCFKFFPEKTLEEQEAEYFNNYTE